MSPEASFTLLLLLTVALLACVVATGRRARRAWHLALVATTLAALVASIVAAKRLGDVYDLSTAGRITPVHLFLAKATTACYLLPLVTGIATILRPRVRPWHARAAYLVLALTLITTVTGAWMLLASQRLG